MDFSNPKPHIIILSSPGLSHLISALEISKQLTTGSGLQVTLIYLASTCQGQSSLAIASLIQSAKSTSDDLDVVQLSPLSESSSAVPPEASTFSRVRKVVHLSMPALKSAVFSLRVPPVAFLADHMAAETLELAKELGIPKYVYGHFCAWRLAVLLSIPGSDEETEGSHRTRAALTLADGFLVNTWEGLESQTLAALRRGDGLLGNLINNAPIYDVGPIVKRPSESTDHEVFQWLDMQPVRSVVFVTFGNSRTLSPEEIDEIALGLEMSQQRFVWVMRSDLDHLPNGFVERTRVVGLVIPQCAPQADVLVHPSMGAVVSHCGWNSILEAITNGLPVITWPLSADQMMNACLIVEEFRMAVRPKVWPSMAAIGREEIADLVRKVMADEEIKKRAKDLKNSSAKALAEGGTSINSLSRFVDQIREKSERLPWSEHKYDSLYAMVHFL